MTSTLIASPRFAASPLAGEGGHGQDYEYVEKEIRNVLSDHPEGIYLPEVLEELWTRLTVPALSAAMLEMFSRRLIALTPDRRLHLLSTEQS
ncbi:hypothetical protein U8D42_17235 [Mycobacterium europaeum]|uniref:hypothetical protein n=1 Tax=Mycobacterium europaeum TaxID=761804 RepID=UPI002ADF4047|nr:hypothetical protein [Mycobacterium europaeum]MEA1159789.1 hypothetical protein [Mycobacterium europaeum]